MTIEQLATKHGYTYGGLKPVARVALKPPAHKNVLTCGMILTPG